MLRQMRVVSKKRMESQKKMVWIEVHADEERHIEEDEASDEEEDGL